jgi:hypothetical protein
MKGLIDADWSFLLLLNISHDRGGSALDLFSLSIPLPFLGERSCTTPIWEGLPPFPEQTKDRIAKSRHGLQKTLSSGALLPPKRLEMSHRHDEIVVEDNTWSLRIGRGIADEVM